MVDVNALYPIVHDLTEAEYSTERPIGPEELYSFATKSSLSFQDMLYQPNKKSHYVSNPSLRQFRETRSETKEDFRSKDDTSEKLADESRGILKKGFEECYLLTRQIDKTNSSTVWEAIHRQSGLMYAIKVVDRRFLLRGEEDAVHNEVEILTMLRANPTNTLNFVDFFDEQKMYIVTENVPDGNLWMHISHRRAISEDNARNLASSLLKGVKYLHSLNICHRDLKPENILVENFDDMDSVLIADFGLAVRLHQDVNENKDSCLLTEKCGSIPFIAPEVLKGIPYGTSADMWSVGVILYMSLSGTDPFGDPSSHLEIVQNICKGDYKFLPEDWWGISFLAKDFVYRLLQVDPNIRLSAEQALQHPWLLVRDLGSTAQHTDRVKQTKRLKWPGKRIRLFFLALFHRRDKEYEPLIEGKESGMDSTASLCGDSVTSNNPRHFRIRPLSVLKRFVAFVLKGMC